MRRFLRRILLIVLTPLAALIALLTGCQGKLIYFPRPYTGDHVARWDAEAGTRVIDFETTDGKQQAYLLSPAPRPERLWVVCAGNATRALEWSDWLRENGGARNAWLMVDYPGYGASEGKPHPDSIRRSLKAAVPAAMDSLDWSLPADRDKLRFFGQSLGGAACLIAAGDHDIRKGVLLAPFTSTMEMTRSMFGVNLGFLVWHRFDNRARLEELAGRGEAEVFILHGSRDGVVPVGMSRELSAEFPTLIRYTEVPGGGHNDLHLMAGEAIRSAIREAGE